MKKSKSFLRKKPMSVAGEKFIHSAVRGASVTGTAYVGSKLSTLAMFSGDNEGRRKFIGPAAFLLGLATEVLVEDDYVASAAQGVQAYGALRTTGDLLLPNEKASFGLAGIGENGGGKRKAQSTIDWNRLAEETQERTYRNGNAIEAGNTEYVGQVNEIEDAIMNLN